MSVPATLPEIADALRQVLSDGAPRHPEDLLAALVARGLDLGVDPDGVLDDLLQSDDLGLVMPILDGRYASLPAMLLGRTFSHRMTAAEIAGGYLEVSPDLEPLSLFPEVEMFRRLVDGTAVTEAISALDEAAIAERGIDPEIVGEVIWLLEPEALTRLGVSPGELIGVSVREEGFQLLAIPEPQAAQDLGSRLASTLDEYADEGPLMLGELVWQICADSPELFRSAPPPLFDAFESAGLVNDGDYVAPPGFDFARWRADRRLNHLSTLHGLDEGEALAVLVLSSVYQQVAAIVESVQATEEAGGDPATWFEDFPAEMHESASAGQDMDDRFSQNMLVRDMLDVLDVPAVAQALVVETIGAGSDGAAALGLFAEALEPQAPRRARPNLRWLRGKALERLGDALEAEAAYEDALTMDPGCVLALYELARFSSDRGNAERGLSLLRRAGAPPDDELVLLLQRFRPVERSDLGRNDRCWCGSGRKYKVCHLNREMPPLEERAAWLYRKASTYLTDGPWRSRAIELAAIRSEYWDAPDPVWQALNDDLVIDALLFEGGAFQAFLDERGMLLPADELLLGQQWLLAERSVHEIETVSPGNGFTSRDVRTGEVLEVRERTASHSLKPGTLICARLVDAGETVQCFGGMEPVALHHRDDLIALLDDEPDPEDLVGFLSSRFAPPALQNTDSERLVFCEATLVAKDTASLTGHLDGMFERLDGENRWHENVVTQGMPRICATLALNGDTLSVETNSEERMDRVLARLLVGVPGLSIVKQKRRPAEDVQEAMGRAPAAGSGALLDPKDPEIAAVLGQVTRRYEEAWLDESIPALKGVTPREAAADPTRRPDLIRLLDSFPTSDPTDFGVMSADRLRAALGL